MCEGSPLLMRPATYFTSGEYARMRRSRAALSPWNLYCAQSSLTLSSSSLTIT